MKSDPNPPLLLLPLTPFPQSYQDPQNGNSLASLPAQAPQQSPYHGDSWQAGEGHSTHLQAFEQAVLSAHLSSPTVSSRPCSAVALCEGASPTFTTPPLRSPQLELLCRAKYTTWYPGVTPQNAMSALCHTQRDRQDTGCMVPSAPQLYENLLDHILKGEQGQVLSCPLYQPPLPSPTLRSSSDSVSFPW